MAALLPPESRLRLVDKLVQAIGFRRRAYTVERIHLATGIPKPHVYRYLPDSASRRVPSPGTTAKVIKALINEGAFQAVLPELDLAERMMRTGYLAYFHWKRKYRQLDMIPDPLSKPSINRLGLRDPRLRHEQSRRIEKVFKHEDTHPEIAAKLASGELTPHAAIEALREAMVPCDCCGCPIYYTQNPYQDPTTGRSATVCTYCLGKLQRGEKTLPKSKARAGRF